MGKHTQMMQVRISLELLERAKAAAAAKCMTLSKWIRTLITDAIQPTSER